MRRAGAWLRAALVLVGVLLADQLTKRWLVSAVAPGARRDVLPGLRLVHTMNEGIAFGFLPGSHAIVVAIIGLALLALLLYFARHAARPLVWLPTGLLLGGALSNILDRLRDGSVTDFIQLPLGWPPFNLADLSITVGVLALALVIEQDSRRGGAAVENDPSQGPAEAAGVGRPR